MATVKRKSSVPYYATAGVWLLYAWLFPLYRADHFIVVGVISAIVFFLLRMLCGTVEVQAENEPKKVEPTGNEALDKMTEDGNRAIAEMRRLNDAIKDEKLSTDIDRMEELSLKIFAHVREHPDKLPQIRKFMDYYLPTSLKLLNAYDRMGAQGVSGENIDSTMHRVDDMMTTVVSAFEKQLDSLFGAEAMDISTDISVMETLMQREGLVGGDEMQPGTGGAAQASAKDTYHEGDLKLEF